MEEKTNGFERVESALYNFSKTLKQFMEHLGYDVKDFPDIEDDSMDSLISESKMEERDLASRSRVPVTKSPKAEVEEIISEVKDIDCPIVHDSDVINTNSSGDFQVVKGISYTNLDNDDFTVHCVKDFSCDNPIVDSLVLNESLGINDGEDHVSLEILNMMSLVSSDYMCFVDKYTASVNLSGELLVNRVISSEKLHDYWFVVDPGGLIIHCNNDNSIGVKFVLNTENLNTNHVVIVDAFLNFNNGGSEMLNEFLIHNVLGIPHSGNFKGKCTADYLGLFDPGGLSSIGSNTSSICVGTDFIRPWIDCEDDMLVKCDDNGWNDVIVKASLCKKMDVNWVELATCFNCDCLSNYRINDETNFDEDSSSGDVGVDLNGCRGLSCFNGKGYKLWFELISGFQGGTISAEILMSIVNVDFWHCNHRQLISGVEPKVNLLYCDLKANVVIDDKCLLVSNGANCFEIGGGRLGIILFDPEGLKNMSSIKHVLDEVITVLVSIKATGDNCLILNGQDVCVLHFGSNCCVNQRVIRFNLFLFDPGGLKGSFGDRSLFIVGENVTFAKEFIHSDYKIINERFNGKPVGSIIFPEVGLDLYWVNVDSASIKEFLVLFGMFVASGVFLKSDWCLVDGTVVFDNSNGEYMVDGEQWTSNFKWYTFVELRVKIDMVTKFAISFWFVLSGTFDYGISSSCISNIVISMRNCSCIKSYFQCSNPSDAEVAKSIGSTTFDVFKHVSLVRMLHIVEMVTNSCAFFSGFCNLEDKLTSSEEEYIKVKSYGLNSQDYRGSCRTSLKNSLAFSCAVIMRNGQLRADGNESCSIPLFCILFELCNGYFLIIVEEWSWKNTLAHSSDFCATVFGYNSRYKVHQLDSGYHSYLVVDTFKFTFSQARTGEFNSQRNLLALYVNFRMSLDSLLAMISSQNSSKGTYRFWRKIQELTKKGISKVLFHAALHVCIELVFFPCELLSKLVQEHERNCLCWIKYFLISGSCKIRQQFHIVLRDMYSTLKANHCNRMVTNSDTSALVATYTDFHTHVIGFNSTTKINDQSRAEVVTWLKGSIIPCCEGFTCFRGILREVMAKIHHQILGHSIHSESNSWNMHVYCTLDGAFGQIASLENNPAAGEVNHSEESRQIVFFPNCYIIRISFTTTHWCYCQLSWVHKL